MEYRLFCPFLSGIPEIVIIYTDDQGFGDVSALNPEAKFKTPNLDKLVNEGITFTDGHSSDAVCTPSRYTLLTGRYSWRTSLKRGVLGADGPCLIEKDRMTIASMLKEHGYNTAMIGKWHLQMDFTGTKGKNRDWSEPFSEGPREHGFDYFFGIPASMNFGVLTYLENDRVLDPPVLWTKKKKNPTPRSYNGEIRPAYYRMTPPYQEEPGEGGGWIEAAPSFNDERVLETFAEKAVDYINQVAQDAKKGKPFFLYFPLTSPHLPHCTHPGFQGRSNCGNYGDFMEETDFRAGQVLEALKSEISKIIITDDQGMGDLGCTGNPYIKTPNIDRFFTDAVRFTNYHAGTTCAPTRAAIMTGQHCNCVNMYHTIVGRSILFEDEVILPQVLAQNGYVNAMYGKWHLGDNYPYRPGKRRPVLPGGEGR